MSSDTPPVSETDSPSDDSHLIRLQKFLAATGLGSRRHCEEYIESGRVSVDGEIVTELGARVDPESQVILVDGERARMEPRRYFLLNKPPGFLCTNQDPAGRRRVIDLFPSEGQRLFTVGRLDENSEGLILVTNDGEMAQRLAHPRYRVARTYQVQVAGHPTREKLDELRKGIRFKEGVFRVSGLKPLKKQGKSTFLELTLHEGQNREIRRMMARIGHKVMQLIRVRFGPLNLNKLKSGEYRRLTDWELKKLRDMLNEKHSPTIRKRKGRKNVSPGRGKSSRRGAGNQGPDRQTEDRRKGGKQRPVGNKGKRGSSAVSRQSGSKNSGQKQSGQKKSTGRRIIGD